MRRETALKIEKQATETLERIGQYRAPVDVEAVAKGLGANLVVEELEDDVSGFLLREGNVTTIAVNRLHSGNRRRFTIAHECGHLLLHKNLGDRLWIDKAYLFRDSRSRTGEINEEIEANRFAAALLMPKQLVIQSLRDREHVTDIDVFKLALQFEVSEQAMTLRLAALDLIKVD